MRDEPNAREPGLVTQIAEVFAGMGRLVQGELRLARAELADSLRGMVGGVAKLVVAAVIALVALNVLAGAAIAALAMTGMGPVWAALIVGLVLAVVALGLGLAGRAALRLDALRPDRTLRSLRRDADALQGGLRSEEP